MIRVKKTCSFIIVICLLLTLLSGCATEEEIIQSGLSVAMVGQPTTLDPASAETQSEITLVSQIFEGLMKVTSTGVSYGNARSYTCEETENETWKYIFRLRSDAYWSDGQAVEAQNYVDAWKRLVDPATQSPYAELLSMVDGYDEARTGNTEKLAVKAISRNVFSVELTTQCPYFIDAICTHFATAPIRTDKTEISGWDSDCSILVSNGPYRLTQLKDGQAILKSDDRYYDAKLTGTEDITVYFENTQEIVNQVYQNDLVDFALDCGAVEDANIGYSQQTVCMSINQNNVTNEELRAALIAVINREALSRIISSDYAMSTGFVGNYIETTQGTNFREVNGDVYTNEAIPSDEYEQLCKEAKQQYKYSQYLEKIQDSQESEEEDTEEKDEETEEETSDAFRIVCSEDIEEQTIAQYLASVWRNRLGIQVTVDVLSEDEFDSAIDNDHYMVAFFRQDLLYNDATAYLNDCISSSEHNYSRYYSNAYDLLLRAAENSSTEEARDAYLEDAETLIIEAGAIIPLYEQIYYYEVKPTVSGYYQDGLGTFRFCTMTIQTEK